MNRTSLPFVAATFAAFCLPVSLLAQSTNLKTPNKNQSAKYKSAIFKGSGNLIRSNAIATFIGGGQSNAIGRGVTNSVVVGGFGNVISNHFGSVGGGLRNFVTNNSDGSSIGGGVANRVLATNVDTGGGQMMQAAAVIAGGQSNTVMAAGGFIGGGAINSAWTNGATVAGGALNAAVGVGSAVVGGFRNEALGVGTFVGGGEKNSADLDNATVGGGEDNTAQGTNATVAGGYNNVAAGTGATVAGGESNFATNYAAVGGGQGNTAGDRSTTVGGGFSNSATGAYGVVAGGFKCSNAAFAGSLGGGYENKLGTGSHITVAGGLYNEAGPGWYSTIPGGVNCKATHDGTFVWSGVDSVTTASTNTNSFTVRAPGGVRFITTTATNNLAIGPGGANGVAVAPGGTAWTTLSDSNAKTAVKVVDPRAVLEKVGRLPVTEWEYKHDPHRRYFGPMAQDFHAAFALGSDDKTINTLDADGVLFLSVKGLVEELKVRDKTIEDLKIKLHSVEQRLNSLPLGP